MLWQYSSTSKKHETLHGGGSFFWNWWKFALRVTSQSSSKTFCLIESWKWELAILSLINSLQYKGVPQGSVLRVSLFALAINDLPTSLPQHVDSSLYLDDLVIFAKSSVPRSAERRIQLSINKSTKLANDHAFNFSQKKSRHALHKDARSFHTSDTLNE